ncbi:hypothetical protein P9K31_08715 [Corynebacterium glutamicum]|uniref:hypothetical protein n=1 Tax=Corynebacterium TaxID=1716 RepID=UPI00072212FE|nr:MULTISPECIES: hypothetical protein [Corynebacterium]ALP49872.1 hypothetical protein AC079_06430 [Corynebacterium glutamicum]ANR62230.1 lipase [[Brevibacterium] flavum ZL-1]ANR65233.1 lipase [Corynebacterium glutamicum ZL-6]ANU33386.1 hypothetical protein BBD29_06230 [Corynebacterium glutamicum]PST76191.1 lipase [Corynebacterium glutamicum ZL-2]
MSLHPEAQHFVELTSKAPDLDTRTPAENRVASEATRHLMGEKTPVAYVHDVLIKGVPVRIYNPPFMQMSSIISDALVARRFIGEELAEAFRGGSRRVHRG